MTDLSITARALLSACAQIMAKGDVGEGLDLSALASELRGQPDAVVKFLAAEAYRLSNGTTTIRKADGNLLAQAAGFGLYLAACPSDTLEIVVMEATKDVTLYQLSSLRNGLHRSPPASPEAVARGRAIQAENDRDRLLAEKGKESVKAFILVLYGACQNLAANAADDAMKDQISKAIRGGAQFFGIDDAATACAIAGLDFGTFVTDALNTLS